MEEYEQDVVRDSIEIKQQVYTCKQFIEEISNLQELSIIYTCRFSEYELAQIYSTTIDNFGVHAMTLPMIKEFINNLRNKNKLQLQEEVNYYRQAISNRLKSNIEKISKKEFWKIIGNRTNKDREGLLSQMFIERSRATPFISCKKILTVLDDVVRQMQDTLQPNLSFENLLKKRISDKEHMEVHGDMEDIINVFRGERKTQLDNYFSIWHHKMDYVYQFIADQEVRYQVQSFLQEVRVLQTDLIEEVKDLCNKNEQLKNTCVQFDQVNKQLSAQVQLYEHALDERKSQIAELTEQIKELEGQNRRILGDYTHLNGAMGEGRNDLVQLSKQYTLVEEQLADYKQRYNQLYSEYESLVKEKNNQDILTKKEQQGKIFTERTMKQQLDDTLFKFNKLLKERKSQRKAFEEKEEKRMLQIQMLEGRVTQLQNEIKSKTEQLNNYVTNSKILEFRSSIIRNSRISMKSGIRDGDVASVGSGIFELRPSKLLRTSMKSNITKREQISPKKKSVKFEEEEAEPDNRPATLRLSYGLGEAIEEGDNMPVTSKSKLKQIDIAAEPLSEIKEEDDISHLVDEALLPPEQNLTNVITTDSILNAHELSGNSPVKVSAKKDVAKIEKNESVLASKAQIQNKDDYFMSKGVLINIYGVRTETTFLMTKKRFCYFDTKLRLSKYLPIENIKSFVFCRTNQTLFIVRPKNIYEMSSKQHITHPLIVSTRNRGAFASFLGQKISKNIKEHQIELMTRYQDDIFLKIDGQQVNMKHKIPHMKNPYRLGLSNAPVFYAKVTEEGIFNTKYTAVIIVQPIGLVCFEGSQSNEIEAGRKFLYLMPLDECKMIEKEDSKQAPGRKVRLLYQHEQMESYYSLIFNSKEDVKLFLKACEDQRKANDQNRTMVYKALDELFKK